MENYYGVCSTDNCVLPATHRWALRKNRVRMICWECAQVALRNNNIVVPTGFYKEVLEAYIQTTQGK